MRTTAGASGIKAEMPPGQEDGPPLAPVAPGESIRSGHPPDYGSLVRQKFRFDKAGAAPFFCAHGHA